MLSYSTKEGISGCIEMIRTDLQSRLLENTATVEREESDVTRAGSQATLLAVYTIYTIIFFILFQFCDETRLASVEVQDAQGHSDHPAPVHDGQGGLPLVGGGRGLACLVQPTVPDVN